MKQKLILIAVVLVLFTQCAGTGKTINETENGGHVDIVQLNYDPVNIAPVRTAEFYSKLGYELFNNGDYLRAVEEFNKALEINSDYIDAINGLGDSFFNIFDFINAEKYFLEVKNIREKTLGTEHPGYALSLSSLGTLYKHTGDYAMSERYHLEAASIFEKALGRDNYNYADSLYNLSALYEITGDYAKALVYTIEALNIYEKVLGVYHPGYTGSLMRLGSLYYIMNDYARAETYFTEAGFYYENILGKNHPLYADFLNSLGTLYYNTGDYSKAEIYYLKSSVIREAFFGEHPYYADSLNNLGVLYFFLSDITEAELHYLKAADIREKTYGKSHPDYIDSLFNLYRLYLTKKDFIEALTYSKEAFRLNTEYMNRIFSFLPEHQRNIYRNDSLNRLESIYSLAWFYPFYESIILSYDNALFSKNLLSDTIDNVRESIFASDDKSLINQFEELGNLRQQIRWLKQNTGNAAYIQTLEDQAEMLEESLALNSAAFGEFHAGLSINWQNVRDSLKPNEAAIEFVSFRVFDRGWTDTVQYAALILRPGMNKPEWVPLCEESVLAELFTRLDTRNQEEQAFLLNSDYGAALYNAVWRPLESALRGVNTIYYSPSGLLCNVFFDAIPSGNLRLMDIYNLNQVSSTREVVQVRADAD
ncbi:MAG: tetratricopeptide repeat protein [Treponema sp.]|nr:tetratricopeptide repeat protein [Treponema sp.]